MKNYFWRNRYLLSSFLIPSLLLLIAYFSRGVFPIGNRNVLTIDLYHQYAPFLAELQARLQSFDGIFYSWSGGLGTNFYALFAYYLASPVNILLAFFPASWLTEAILLIIIVKIGLAGASFYYFQREVYQENSVILVAIASAYGLSSYIMAYVWNVMWLDGIALLPLIILGLVRVIRDRRYVLYPVSLGLALFTNYYIAYFIVVFTALYGIAALFIYQNGIKPLRLLKQIGQLILLSILGAGLSAVLTWPTYLSLKLTSAADDKFGGTITHYFDLFDYISQHFLVMPPTIRDGMPNLYAGLFALLMIPVFFFAKRIPLKSKILHFLLLLTLIVSFNINALNFFWHGFHYPNQLPYRNSFVYIFLVLSMSYPAWKSLVDFSGKQIGTIVAVLMGFVILAQKLNDKPLPMPVIYATILFFVAYAAVLTLGKSHTIHPADLAIALLLVMIAELSVNTLVSMHKVDTTEYLSSREGYSTGVEVDQIREQLDLIKSQDESFYRTEVVPPKTTNDGFLYQYNGLSVFASTSATKPVQFFENLGFHSNSINSYKYEGSTLVLDSVFGIKYLIRRNNFIDDRLRQPISQTSELEVFSNPYALPLGLMAPTALHDFHLPAGDPLMAQNSLIMALGGQTNVLKPINQITGQQANIEIAPFGTHGFNYTRPVQDEVSRAQILIENPIDQQLYLYLKVTANQPDQGYVLIDDMRVDFNAKRSTLVDLGHVRAGSRVEFNLTFKKTSNTSGTFSLYSYALDQAAFTQSIQTLKSSALQIDKVSDAQIKGFVDNESDGVMLITVPFDQAWRVKVDGKSVETFAVSDGLLGFDVPQGVHQILLNYRPLGFLLGLLVTLGSLVMLAALHYWTRKTPLVMQPEESV
ncbi:MAG: YfhO family protein [Eubacteriales bacterium]|nr:YfhO family protein [Eubacteriales bacterium]